MCTIKQNLNQYQQDQPQIVLDFKQSIYVDNLIDGGDNVGSAKAFKQSVIKLFDEVGFKLYKWIFNVTELEEKKHHSQIKSDEIYA